MNIIKFGANKKLLKEAVELLDKQRYRALYPMDEQLATQKKIAKFIEDNR